MPARLDFYPGLPADFAVQVRRQPSHQVFPRASGWGLGLSARRLAGQHRRSAAAVQHPGAADLSSSGLWPAVLWLSLVAAGYLSRQRFGYCRVRLLSIQPLEASLFRLYCPVPGQPYHSHQPVRVRHGVSPPCRRGGAIHSRPRVAARHLRRVDFAVDLLLSLSPLFLCRGQFGISGQLSSCLPN